ncbi:MAG: hypothetical protein ACLFSQ_11940 [Candidatus Zixiibacteriota bacterium]
MRAMIIGKIQRNYEDIKEMEDIEQTKVELLGIVLFKISQYIKMGGDLRMLDSKLDNILESGNKSNIDIDSYSNAKAIIEL